MRICEYEYSGYAYTYTQNVHVYSRILVHVDVVLSPSPAPRNVIDRGFANRMRHVPWLPNTPFFAEVQSVQVPPPLVQAVASQ